MAKSNLAQHELHLKALETLSSEILTSQRRMYDISRQSCNMAYRLFELIDHLRTTRLDFEKTGSE